VDVLFGPFAAAGGNEGIELARKLAPHRLDVPGRVVLRRARIARRGTALVEKGAEPAQGSRQRRERAGGPLQFARMRGARRQRRQRRLDGGQHAGDRASTNRGGRDSLCRDGTAAIPVHVTFYRALRPGLVEIVRVLHDRMEPRRHIGPDRQGEE
jgi:plasmid stabilization system protein ParE